MTREPAPTATLTRTAHEGDTDSDGSETVASGTPAVIDASAPTQPAPEPGVLESAHAAEADSEETAAAASLPDTAPVSAAPTAPVDETIVDDGQSTDPDSAAGDVPSTTEADTSAPLSVPTQTPAPFGLEQAHDVVARLQARLRAQILGRDDVLDLVLVALLADGHVLLEDYPGSGKTTLAKTLGQSIVDDTDLGPLDEDERTIVPFRRIQFTPDLLPSDVTGVSVFDAASGDFHFRAGPLFAHVVLADEINRTSPKVQAAMLEAMAEKQVTVDNVTHPLDDLFFVIATQNPLDLAGTYPLPAPQLDRFLFKIRMDHIDRDAELEVLTTYRSRRDTARDDLPRVSRDDVLRARTVIDREVAIDDAVKACLVDLSRTLRTDERVLQGNSTRSLVLILPALQAMATLRGRDYVSSDDIETLIPRVLGHRIELAPGVTDMDDVLHDAMAKPLDALARGTLRRR